MKDPRVDTYIKKAQPFARPVLTHLRKIVHQAHPQIAETIKWGMPFFQDKGPVCFMSAFKEHAAFGFWKGKLLFGNEDKGGMGHFGRITSTNDLPAAKKLIGYVRKAVKLNEGGVKKTRLRAGVRRRLIAPSDLKAALEKHAKAKKTFDNLSYSHKKQYVQWITEAKRDETRKKRLKRAIQWLSAGKPQNWRYM